MLKPRSAQRSFLDTDTITEPLLPSDSFYRKFRQLVWPLIQDDQFESLYCPDNGRPAISPALLAMATILQFHENLSDRAMEQACQYDLRLKYALGLGIDERPFDHSSLGDFRDRLLKHQKEKEIFDRLLEKLIEQGLIARDEPQRIDATHVIADIAIPSVITLVKKGIYEILKPLKKRHGEIFQQLATEIDLANYAKEKVNQNGPGKIDPEKRTRWLLDVIGDARKVLEHARSIEGDPILTRRVQMLQRILQENMEENEKGQSQEREYKNKPKDMLASPVDPDARYGAKSPTKRFTGYKANLTETILSRFITSIQTIPGNRPDGETMVAAITGQERFGLMPPKVIGDTAYSDGAFRQALKAHGTQLVAPLRVKSKRSQAVLPRRLFHYDEATETITCPAGATARMDYYNKRDGIKMFHFPIARCRRCVHQSRCTHAAEGRRTISLRASDRELMEAEKYNLTKQFKADIKLRQPIEGKISELKRYHGLTRTRYRGLRKVSLQCHFTAAAVNLKRWVKLLLQGASPPVSVAAA